MMDFKDLAERFPEFPFALQVNGAAFETLMGAEWVAKHPKVPLLQTQEDMAEFAKAMELPIPAVKKSIERFLGSPRALEDDSEVVRAARELYRDLFLKFVPDFWKELQPQLAIDGLGPSGQARLSVLALNVWACDPRKDPQAWKLWFVAGFAFVQLDERQRAARFLAQAIVAYPNAVPALNELAALLLADGRRDEGEPLLNKVLDLEPNNVTALCNAAALRLETGRLEEAKVLLARAQAAAPDDPHVLHLQKLASRS
jgi:tetratricopeptide (TPR) repeat protein